MKRSGGQALLVILLPICLGALGCDGGRARPLTPNDGVGGSRARDASDSGAVAVGDGGPSEGRDGSARDGEGDDGGRDHDAGLGDVYDTGPFFFDATPGRDGRAPGEDAEPALDARTFPDASDPRDVGFPDAGAPAPRDAGFAPDAPAPDAFVPPRDAGLAPDAFVPPPDAGFAPDAFVPRDGGSVQDAGTPACTNDSQCSTGSRCHPLYRQCVPAGQRAYCESCTSDSECGLPGDHCMDVGTAAGMFLERVCLQACRAATDCPRGFECSLAGHCYPVPGSIRLHTCASLADMYAGELCNAINGPDVCGIPNYEDGTCVPTLGCSIGCDTQTDCPPGSNCTNYIVASYCVPN